MQELPSETKNDLAAGILEELLKEKRADRRWKNIRFFCLVRAYCLFDNRSLYANAWQNG